MGVEIGVTSLKLADRVEFFRTLSGWLQAGKGRMPVAEAVSNTAEAFSHDEYKTLRSKMQMITREVQGAQTPLYEALAVSDLGFARQELAIIEAAEKSNQLRQAIPALTNALDMQLTGKRSLMTQLAMPIGIAIALILMSLGVLLYMLPMIIQPVLDRRPDALEDFPFILQMYWHASVWLRANIYVPVFIAALPVLLLLFKNNSLIRPYIEAFKLWFKPVRNLVLAYNSVVTVYFMPALIRSGLPTFRVLHAVSECLENPTLKNAFKNAARDNENGMRLGAVLDLIPYKPSFVNSVVAGEQTGELAERIEDLQEPYTIEMNRQIRALVSKLKFLVMAVLLPFFILSTYTTLVGPIFALMEY